MPDRSSPQNFFITAEVLSSAMNQRPIKLVDASWYLPTMNRNGKKEYNEERISGAQFFDINAIADTTSELPHMLPSPEIFAKAVGKMGISETDEIVIYDGPGLFASARVWWTFRIMGAANVKILAGGMDGWKALGLPVETSAPLISEMTKFTTNFQAKKARDYSYMLANVKRGDTLVLDARPMGRFTGEVPEPREGLRSGHIPGSKPLPAMDLVENGIFIESDLLLEKLNELGVANAAHVTTTCGSGVTAAILSLALETAGFTDHSLYDGSWTEWGSTKELPTARWK